MVVDASFDIEESDDTNNRLTQKLPLPTLPPTCTPLARHTPATPTPTLTPTEPSPPPTLTPGPTDTSPPPTVTPAPTDTPLPPTSTPVPSLPGAGETRTRGKDDMQIVYVPAGEFLMGSTDADSDAHGYEKPQHTVYLGAYWIDQTEVTNAQYAHFMNEMGGHSNNCGGGPASRQRIKTMTATFWPREGSTWRRADLTTIR